MLPGVASVNVRDAEPPRGRTLEKVFGSGGDSDVVVDEVGVSKYVVQPLTMAANTTTIQAAHFISRM